MPLGLMISKFEIQQHTLQLYSNCIEIEILVLGDLSGRRLTKISISTRIFQVVYLYNSKLKKENPFN